MDQAEFAPPGLLVQPRGVVLPLPPALQPEEREVPVREVEDAVTHFLSKRPGQQELLTKVGVYLRARSLAPSEGLKRFLLTRSTKFVISELKPGREVVGIAGHMRPPPLPGVTVPANGHPPPEQELSEADLEAALVGYLQGEAGPVAMPQLGEFCNSKLGVNMRNKLGRFIAARPHLFQISDRAKCMVVLAGGAAPQRRASSTGGSGGEPQLPEDLVMPGGSAGDPPGGSGPPPFPEAHGYAKWDAVTRAIYAFVRSRRSATMAQIDEHMRNECRHKVSAFRINPDVFRSQVFLAKRRGIFRLDGPNVSLARPPSGGSPSGSPLHSAAAASPAMAPGFCSGPVAAAAAAASRSAEAAGSDAGATTGVGLSQTGRKELDSMLAELRGSLPSLKALVDLQRENAGLRAACVTLGRELIKLKDEVGALRSQVLAAPAMSSPAMAGTGLSPAAAAGLLLSAGVPAAAATMAMRPSEPPGILLVGGNDGGAWLDAVDFFAPSVPLWAPGAGMGVARSFAAAASNSAAAFVVGGGNGDDWYGSVLRYDRAQGALGSAWQPLGPLRLARGSLAAALTDDGRLFAYGGGRPKVQLAAVEWYDPQINSWLECPPMTRPRFALGGACVGGALYAVGGYDGDSYLASTERWDPREPRWSLLPGQMSTKRGAHAVAAVGGTLYALGGFDSAAAIATAEVYDPRAGSWRVVASMEGPRAYGAAVSCSGVLYALGGLQSDMQTHALLAEWYDPHANAWRHVELPENANPRRAFLAAAALD